jgi:hypothetical protein
VEGGCRGQGQPCSDDGPGQLDDCLESIKSRNHASVARMSSEEKADVVSRGLGRRQSK